MENSSLTFEYDKVSQMHIELTNRCNAACPMCVRFYNNSPLLRPDIQLGEISIDQFKSWFPPEFLNHVQLILFCGVHGDPCIARDTLEIVEYIIQESPKTKIRFNTNGGMRNPEWWLKLGNMLKHNSEHYVTFSIDGLKDTNHIYRRNVIWDKLMANVTAFNSTGATSIWDFLMFKHNEHQIEEAKELAKTLNFTQFVSKKALGVDNGTHLQPMVALDKNGKFEYVIEAPTDPAKRNLEKPVGVKPHHSWTFTKDEYNNLKQNNAEGLINFHKRRYDNVYDEIKKKDFVEHDRCEIKCKSKRDDGVEIFVDNYGNVLPCCYIGTRMNGLYSDIATLQLHYETKKNGYDNLSLQKKTLKEILNSGYLDSVYVDSWNKSSIAEGKMLYCSETCGQQSSIDRIFFDKGKERLK